MSAETLDLSRAPSVSPATPLIVGEGRCIPHIEEVDGWWRAEVTFDGQRRYIGRCDTKIRADEMAQRWINAYLGVSAPPKKRGEGGCKPVRVTAGQKNGGSRNTW